MSDTFELIFVNCIMGHFITAFNNASQIARLKFGATNYVLSSYLYKILNAEDCNNGVSGSGVSKIYTYDDILKAKSALAYYEKEPFELVRNKENEQQAELFIDNVPGIISTRQEHFSIQEISEGISSVREFLEAILTIAPTTNVVVHFG